MAKELNEDTGFNVSIKSLAGLGFVMATIIGMWFTLQADIAEAKELPEPLPPDVTRMEFDMKDQLIRQTIMTTQKDVEEVKEDMKRIEEKLDKLIEKGDNHENVFYNTRVIYINIMFFTNTSYTI